MSFTDDQIATIDARIDAQLYQLLRGPTTALGTVAAITGDNDALVTFDGSALAIPVKLAGNVNWLTGDRVALGKFGLWWVALVPLTRRWMSWTGANAVQSSGGTTITGAASDVPNPVQAVFTKRWDHTAVHVEVTGAGWSNGAGNTQATFGAYFGTPNQPIIPTYSVTRIFFNNASMHMTGRDSRIITDLIADTYTVSVRWSRTLGTGTLTLDSSDQVGLTVAEIAS